MKQGRPSAFSQEIADRLCAEISTTSKSLKTICKDENMPSAVTIFAWLRTNEAFLNQYTRAKEEQADLMIEEMIDIADDGSNDYMTITKGDLEYEVENKELVNRSRLRVDTRKWIASKLKPKKYGDKLDITTDNKPIVNEIDYTKLSSEVLTELLNAGVPENKPE